ncbi:hypothetical protein N333_03801, partial [Nestor notabilis]
GWKRSDVVCAHSKAHSANHCSHRARCSSASGLLASLNASCPAPSSPASWLSSSSFCIVLSFRSWMVSSSRGASLTLWGTQLLSIAVTKGSGAQTSMSSLPVGMRR